jgi:methylthioribose-1-phosphate isomerase
VIPTELFVSWVALVIAAAWIIHQWQELRERDDILKKVKAALEAADKSLDLYQTILRDVAIGHATLEVTNDGRIIATHCSAGKVSLH